MQFVERSVRARVGGAPSHSTVSVSCRASRRLVAAPGLGAVELFGQSQQRRFRLDRGSGVVGVSHPASYSAAKPLRQMIFHVNPNLVELTTLDDRVVEHVDDGLAQRLGAVQAPQHRAGDAQAPPTPGPPAPPLPALPPKAVAPGPPAAPLCQYAGYMLDARVHRAMPVLACANG